MGRTNTSAMADPSAIALIPVGFAREKRWLATGETKPYRRKTLKWSTFEWRKICCSCAERCQERSVDLSFCVPQPKGKQDGSSCYRADFERSNFRCQSARTFVAPGGGDATRQPAGGQRSDEIKGVCEGRRQKTLASKGHRARAGR